MATEPKYIGFVRFGAGDGCPCGGAGERLLTVRKHQHRWESVRGSGIAPGPKENNLRQLAEGPLWAPHPEDAYDAVEIDQIIGRYTGLITGPLALWPQGDPYYQVTSQTGILTTWRHAFRSSWGTGSIRLLEEYTLGALRDDAAMVGRDPLAGIGAVPWGAQSIGGFEELSKGGVGITLAGEPAVGNGSVAWLGLGPLTGNPRAIVTERDEQIWTRGQTTAVLQATLEWSSYYARQIAQIRFRGRFSTEEFVRIDLAGGAPGAERLSSRRYWVITRGILEIWSPDVTDADASETDFRAIRGVRVRLGDVAPEGTPTEEWVGVAGASTGC